VAITKLEKFLEKYTPSNGFDKLIYDFYRQFPGLLKSGLVIKDSDRVSALQEYIKHLFDESVQEIESKEKGRVNEKNILPRMRDKIDHVIFNDYKLEIKMILGGHYRNEMPGSSDWTDYRELVSKLLDLETNQKKTQEEKQIHDKLKVKYYSRLLPEERKGVF
jgi:ATP-dependent protease HslVU (ClpYQ) ATPase subunit